MGPLEPSTDPTLSQSQKNPLTDPILSSAEDEPSFVGNKEIRPFFHRIHTAKSIYPTLGRASLRRKLVASKSVLQPMSSVPDYTVRGSGEGRSQRKRKKTATRTGDIHNHIQKKKKKTDNNNNNNNDNQKDQKTSTKTTMSSVKTKSNNSI